MARKVQTVKKRAKDTKDTPKRAAVNKRAGKARRDWKPAFLKAFRESANVRAACEAAKISRKHVYRTRETDREFADLWDEAEADACDILELEARRRAVEGVAEPVFGSLGRGMPSGKIGTIIRYSNTLLMFLLRAHNPGKYGDRVRNENVDLDVSTLNDAQLNLLANGAPLPAILAAASAGGTGTETAPIPNRDAAHPTAKS